MNDYSGYLHWRPEFLKVIDQRLYPVVWIDSLVLSGAATFLQTDKAALLIEAKEYPSGARDVHALVAAGDLGDIVNVLRPAAEAWGVANGCVGALVESREGWARALREFGYAPWQATVRKELI
jgi:hypothetical protein